MVTSVTPLVLWFLVLRHGAVLKKAAVDAAFSEVEKCIPNPCENNATFLSDRIRCRCICPAAADPDNAIVGVKCNETVSTAPENFPLITGMWPRRGMTAGGSRIVFFGRRLDAFAPLGAYFRPPADSGLPDLYGLAYSSGSRYLVVISPTATNTSYERFDLRVEVEYSGPQLINSSTPLRFRYAGNPDIHAIGPGRIANSGGVRLTISGSNLDLVERPKMNTSAIIIEGGMLRRHNYSITECMGRGEQLPLIDLPPEPMEIDSWSSSSRKDDDDDDTEATFSKRRRRRDTDSNHGDGWTRLGRLWNLALRTASWWTDTPPPSSRRLSRHKRAPVSPVSNRNVTMKLYPVFIMDKLTSLRNPIKIKPNLKFKLVPFTFKCDDTPVTFDPSVDRLIKIKAVDEEQFNYGKEDYRIVIESTNCTVEKVTANEIDFRPPIRKPDLDERFRYNNVSRLRCHQSGSLHVQAYIGLLPIAYDVFCVKYVSSATPTTVQAIVVPVIALSCLLVVVAATVYYIHRRRRRRRQTSVEPAAPDDAGSYLEMFGRRAGTDTNHRGTTGRNVRLNFHGPQLDFDEQ